MKKIFLIQLFVTVCFIFGCKEIYTPALSSLQKSFLVVEGILNVGQDTTIIHLSRTFSLDELATTNPENNAQIIVEGKDNTTSLLSGTGKGNYVSANLNLAVNHEYRVRIKTVGGKEYLSDYVKAKITPAIDSISWKRNYKGIQVYANSHDPANATKYYRWDYGEIWEIHSHFSSGIIYENGIIRDRIFPQEDVFVCWKNQSSTNILLANSLRLQSDIISEAPLVLIPVGDEKLFVRYSILVRQYALEQDAYNFFELMKKNTEDIGSLFSPQPSEIKGNLHCVTNADEFVIGFVTASTITEKRIFISAAQVEPWPNLDNCKEIPVPGLPASIKEAIDVGLLPYSKISGPPAGYLFSTAECVDCRTRGGSKARPIFW